MPHSLTTKPMGSEGTQVDASISYDSFANPNAHSQNNGNLDSQIDQALERLRQLQIMVPQPAEVREYLNRYADVIDLVPSISNHARERFGIDTQLSLELYCDPEIDDEYLTLYVRQEQYDQSIFDNIENISAQFDTALAGKSGWLIVTTDFSPPR